MGCLIFAGFMAVVFAIEFPWLWLVYFFFFALAMICLLVEKRQAAKEAQLKSKQEAERIISRELMNFGIRSGREEFSNKPIDEDLPCKVVVQGVDSYSPVVNKPPKIDAAYHFGEQEYIRHHRLLFDGQPAELFEEDPHTHTYSFVYYGASRQLSIVLKIPNASTSCAGDSTPLSVSIRTLTLAEETEFTAKADERKRKETEMARADLNQQALVLAAQADLGRNFLEHDFQHSYATKFTTRILTQERREWFTEYQQLRSNEPLFTLVQEHYPQVLEFFSARFEVVRIAERLEVQPAPPSDPEPQRKETPEEYLERRRRRLKNNAQLKLAKILEQLEATRSLREQAEQVGSDEEVTEKLVNELLQDFADDEKDTSNGWQQL